MPWDRRSMSKWNLPRIERFLLNCFQSFFWVKSLDQSELGWSLQWTQAKDSSAGVMLICYFKTWASDTGESWSAQPMQDNYRCLGLCLEGNMHLEISTFCEGVGPHLWALRNRSNHCHKISYVSLKRKSVMKLWIILPKQWITSFEGKLPAGRKSGFYETVIQRLVLVIERGVVMSYKKIQRSAVYSAER
jgi:hypothetical protein